MSNNWQKDVREFMERFGQQTPCDPCVPDESVLSLRRQLLMQETMETIDAANRKDLPGMIDGVVDVVYVSLGLAVACGVDIGPIWNAVHAANMLKEPYSPEKALELQRRGIRGIVPGKVLKPAGWQPANIADCINRQRRR